MEDRITIYIKTPFNTFVKTYGMFNTNDKYLTIMCDKDPKDNEVYIDLSVVIDEDVKSIIKDVNEHKETNYEKYHDYDANDIKLDEIRLENGYITCHYTINAGTYRRFCVGFLSKVMPKNGIRHTYLAYPPTYRGGVCW